MLKFSKKNSGIKFDVISKCAYVTSALFHIKKPICSLIKYVLETKFCCAVLNGLIKARLVFRLYFQLHLIIYYLQTAAQELLAPFVHLEKSNSIYKKILLL